MADEVAPAVIRQAARRALALDDEALAAECEIEVYVASGPGGQHRNKTESGVRMRHPATGVLVTATERRSQAQNREVALERMRVRLKALTYVPKRRVATKPSRAAKARRVNEKKARGATKALRRDRPDRD